MYGRTLLLTLAAVSLLVGQREARVQSGVSSELSDSARIQSLRSTTRTAPSKSPAGTKTRLDVSATGYAETQQFTGGAQIDIAVGSGGAVIRTLPPLDRATLESSYVIKVPGAPS